MIRLKILKKEGAGIANWIFMAESKANIKGITFNLENGQIIESKLNSESIFKERITNDRYRFRLAMPNVKVGSVIDIQYTHFSIPLVWRFQDNIPIRWSELIIEKNKYIDFRKNTFGNIHFAEQSDIRWVTKDVPAFKSEPYINSVENYIWKFELDILSISFPGYFDAYTTSWEAVSKQLVEHPYFGKTMPLTLFLNSVANDIENKYKDPQEKMRAAFETIKVVKWNDQVNLFTSHTNLSYPYNKKIGNSADINLLLVQLLKKLNFKAYPVALSTRENGLIRPFSPSLEKLNYTIACIKNADQVILFDASEELMPMGLLPRRCLNEKGRIIDLNISEWVPIVAEKKDKQIVQYDIKLGDNDAFTGKIAKTRIDYSAYQFRKKYKEFNSQEEYLKDFEQDNTGLWVENCTITNLDSIYMPLKEDYDVKIKNKVSRVGDLVYINPMFFEQITENPFKLDDRKYAADFAYPREFIYQLKLSIPEGMKVEQIPKPSVIKMPDNGISCTYQITNNNGTIILYYKFLMNKTIYQPAEYYSLKAIYTELVKKHAELIILKNVVQ
jgi:hypothetical protein